MKRLIDNVKVYEGKKENFKERHKYRHNGEEKDHKGMLWMTLC